MMRRFGPSLTIALPVVVWALLAVAFLVALAAVNLIHDIGGVWP